MAFTWNIIQWWIVKFFLYIFMHDLYNSFFFTIEFFTYDHHGKKSYKFSVYKLGHQPYNVMSSKFRTAFLKVLRLPWAVGKPLGQRKWTLGRESTLTTQASNSGFSSGRDWNNLASTEDGQRELIRGIYLSKIRKLFGSNQKIIANVNSEYRWWKTRCAEIRPPD